MKGLKRFLVMLGWMLLLLSIAQPARVQGSEEGWQVYVNANYVCDIAHEGGGMLGGGYTWFATNVGVFCYSATEHVRFTISDGLASDAVSAISIDSEGYLWFGTGGGVSVLDHGGTRFGKGDDNWISFKSTVGLGIGSVSDIAVDSEGRWWFATSSGLIILDDGGTPFDPLDDAWAPFPTAGDVPIDWAHAVVVDDAGRVWVGSYSGASVLDHNGTPLYKGDDTWTTFSSSSVVAIGMYGERWMWFGKVHHLTWSGGLSLQDHADTPFEKSDDQWKYYLVGINVYAITEDSAGRWWFGTISGVRMLDDGGTPFEDSDDTWVPFTTTSSGLASNGVYAIAEDDGGRMWFGTAEGVSVLDDRGTPFYKPDDTWTTIILADGLASNQVNAIAKDGEEWMWFGTWGSGVSALDNRGTPFDKGDDAWVTFTTADGLVGACINTIAIDREERLWFGTNYNGVGALDDGGTPFDKRDDTWGSFTTANSELASGYIYAITEDSAGQLWFGTARGVSVLDHRGTFPYQGDDFWATFTTTHGLAHDQVGAVMEDNGGRMWFGTDAGVSVLDYGDTPFDQIGDTWTTFTTTHSLRLGSIDAIVEDGGGRLWFARSGNVSVLDCGGTPFDKRDDTWITLAGGSGYGVVLDSRGRLWFNSSNGVSVLDHGGTPFDSGDDTWTRFTTVDGLAYDSVSAIVEDSEGWVWFGTSVGGVSELVDAVAPSSRASSSSSPVVESTIPVSWSASDGASGVFRVSLWVRYGSSGAWTETGLSRRGESAGTFHYAPTRGNGTYCFATVAEDWMGNVEAAPAGAGDTCTVYNGPNPGDAYEPDDACAQSSSIPTDGTVQVHTFHQQGDADWVTFAATSGTTYLIEARVPAGSLADVVLELYDRCGGSLQDSQDYDFSPGVRLRFQAPASGLLYLRLANHDPAVQGSQAAYHLSVRALDDAPSPGAVVLVAGRLREGDPVQDNIHSVTDAAYRLFLEQGYDGERIHYLTTDPSLDPDRDGVPDVDGPPTRENLEQAITQWAVDKVGPDHPLTLYLADHGRYDKFYLDRPQDEQDGWVGPGHVSGWLGQLEGLVPGVKINVIVEACHSGSFIDRAQTVSGPGRAIIASTGAYALAYASGTGAVFSDHFLAALRRGESLCAAFQSARWVAEVAHPAQTPWLDDDGDGVANGAGDCAEAALRDFTFAGTLPIESWPPYVAQVVGPAVIGGEQGVVRAEVRDDERVRRVWAVVYPPSYRPPQVGEELVREALPTIVLLDQGNDWYGATYAGFDEVGVYQVVVYAEDDEGLEAQPVAIEVRTGWSVYLPLVLR